MHSHLYKIKWNQIYRNSVPMKWKLKFEKIIEIYSELRLAIFALILSLSIVDKHETVTAFLKLKNLFLR